MTLEFKLPDIGEGVVEGEIVKWLVQPGERIEVDQPIVEVMTDKATVVIPSPTRGVVRETRGEEGAVVEVHSVIVVIDEDQLPARETQDSPQTDVPVSRAPAGSTLPSPLRAVPERPSRPSPKVLAAPATRRLARELGVDLSRLSGTGPAGRVTTADVRAASATEAGPVVEASPRPPRAAPPKIAAAIAPPPAAHPADHAPVPVVPVIPGVRSVLPEPVAADQTVPVRGLRRRIWEKMAQSAFTAAHFTFVEECDMTELVAVRARFNAHLEEGEPKLNFLPFIAKAVLSALRKFPQLNGHVDDDAMQFIQRGAYHLGVAVSSERGLVVPVVRNADRLSIVELEREIRRLADAVRGGSLRSDDLGGSTFTITSLGKDGGLFATPIINYPEVGILGVHKISKRPMVIEDEIKIRHMMNLSLSFDHRLVDGHVGAAFTYAVIRLLEVPDRLLMEMT